MAKMGKVSLVLEFRTQILTGKLRHYLHLMLGDPLEALKTATPDAFATYLEWRCYESPFEGLHRSTIHAYWKRISACYRLKVTRFGTTDEARSKVKEALGNGGHLVRKFDLDTEVGVKDVMSIDDFLEVLSTLWQASVDQLFLQSEQQRAQLWLFEHIAAYTGSRPGALVERSTPALCFRAYNYSR
jgi:hypothetical protein